MISVILSRIVIVVLGTLYPAYASYKAVKTKNVKEYVKWMMYWIVFALFICVETFADIFISWIPFYYEIKIVFVIWLMAPATKGASILYRKFIHPQLSKREEEIDSYISRVSEQGYSALLNLGSKGLSFAANIVVSTAIKGQTTLAGHLRNSYSLNDLSLDSAEQKRYVTDDEEEDDETDNRRIQERFKQEVQEMQDNRDNDNRDNDNRDNDNRDSGDERGTPSSATVRRSASSRAARAKDAELYPVKELDEIHGEMQTRHRSSKKSAYTHNEVSHYGTLPRKAKHTRPAV